MGLSLLLSLCLPPLLTVPTDGRPMRFGISFPAVELERGLALGGRGAMQWRLLPVGAADSENVWIELAIVAPRGTVRIVRGGDGPCANGRGPAFVLSREEYRIACGAVRVMRWQWVDGTVDERTRTTFTATTELGGEVYQAGEGLTLHTEGLASRAMYWLHRGRDPAIRCGLLPVRASGLTATKNVRRHLHKVLPHLVEMGGQRGAGDFARRDGVVTNLEFDTTLALLRCAVAMHEPRAWQLALRAARHLRDRDLDVQTGLPFMHGVSHRAAPPEPGHTWLEGLLWVGLLTADDDVLVAARSMGRALAVHLPVGTGRNELLRDYAWPLMQIESLLRVAPVKQLVLAADRLAASIQMRFDGTARTFRFGEGELGGGVYLERGWLTAGILIPALRLHLQRRPAAALAEQVRVVQQSLMDRIGSGARGLPTHWRIANGRVSAEHYERKTARASWLLEALSPLDQSRLLRRSSVRRAVAATPAFDHPDLATEFTLLARCRWVWR